MSNYGRLNLSCSNIRYKIKNYVSTYNKIRLIVKTNKLINREELPFRRTRNVSVTQKRLEMLQWDL